MPRRRLPNLGLSGPLYHGLHTRCLRFAAPGYPDATQDSLPVGGQSLPGRVLTYRVHYEGFPFLSIAFSFPPSQAWPGARHKAWGFNPRKAGVRGFMSPEGATADQHSEENCRRPVGALDMAWDRLPGADAPGYMPAPLSGLAEVGASTGEALPLLPLLPLAEQHLPLQDRPLGAVEGVEEAARRHVPALAGPADLGLDLVADLLQDAPVEHSLVVAPQEVLQHLQLVDAVDVELLAGERKLLRRHGL